jgi:hypothetical protein
MPESIAVYLDTIVPPVTTARTFIVLRARSIAATLRSAWMRLRRSSLAQSTASNAAMAQP